MERATKLLIAASESQWASSLAKGVSELKETELIGTVKNGRDALESIVRKKPDIIILDMLLQIIDGLGVLEEITKMPDYKPKIICVSPENNDFMVKNSFAMGASYFMKLPMDISVLIRRIKMLNSSSHTNNITQFFGNTASGVMTLDEEITAIFLQIGIPAHIKGYQYLREAVKMSINDTSMVNQITKKLYPGIGNIFGITPSKVERAIRHAIDVAWNRGRIQDMNDVFGINIFQPNDRPTNGEFIALVADRLRMRDGA